MFMTDARPGIRKFCLLLLITFWVRPAWAVPVTLATVQKSNWSRTIPVMGQVESVGMVTLTAPMTGRITGPFPATGTVAAGTVIAHVDAPGLQARLHAAEAQVEYARTALRRDEQLLKDGVVARATVEASRASYEQALGNARALRAEAVDQALTAPFTGNIRYLIAPGTVVAAGTPIASISGRAQPWVEALVPPELVFRLHPGEPAALRAHRWHGIGKIHSIGSSARQSGLVSVILHLPPHAPVLPGEWLSIQLQTSERPVLRVPAAAVVMHGAKPLVYLDKNGRAQGVSVRVLGVEHGVAYLSGALRPGEQVVVSGSTRLRAHSPLETRE
ncbi:efflux RND transporter periplasmic adaptor subunit [Acidithiobacillus caldus]